MSYKIAIDGPSSAGKSTVAKLLAKDLGYVYIDTGAMYRALGYYLINKNISCEDVENIVKNLSDIDIDIKYIDDEQIVFLNGKNVNDKIRTQAVSDAASKCSTIKEVRDKLINMQRKLASEYNCVMDGRDIGSNVLKDANLKIYLTADIDCRAKRRYEENIKKGIKTTLSETKKDLEERDYRDTHREHNPLVCVKEAIYIDSSDMTVDQVVDKIIECADGANR